eukprot:Gb_05432 [translate_table: standard]
MFLASKVDLAFTHKIVCAMHWYAFTDGKAWKQGNANQLSGFVTSRINYHGAFIARLSGRSPTPFFISEFDIDQRGNNLNHNRYINYFLAFAADGDFDWALWTFQGIYYIQNGQPGFQEIYGVFNGHWNGLRNPSFLARLQSIQQPFQDPFSSQGSLHQAIYHPPPDSSSMLTVETHSSLIPTKYRGQQGPIDLVGNYLCIGAQGNGLVVVLTAQCSTPNSLW